MFWKDWKVFVCCGISSKQTCKSISRWCNTEHLVFAYKYRLFSLQKSKNTAECPRVWTRYHSFHFTVEVALFEGLGVVNIYFQQLLLLPGFIGHPSVVLRVSLLLRENALRLQQPAGNLVQGSWETHVQLDFVLTKLKHEHTHTHIHNTNLTR